MLLFAGRVLARAEPARMQLPKSQSRPAAGPWGHPSFLERMGPCRQRTTSSKSDTHTAPMPLGEGRTRLAAASTPDASQALHGSLS